jgi:hypothetical protein
MISLQETEVKRILNFFEESGRIEKNPLSHCCAMTLAGLRLPAITSCKNALVLCWPLPQQQLPVSATGGGRCCCSRRASFLLLSMGHYFTVKEDLPVTAHKLPLLGGAGREAA